MSTPKEDKEDTEMLLQKIMKLIPKNEKEELKERISLPPFRRSQILKNNLDKTDSSNENIISNPETKINTTETQEDSNIQTNNKIKNIPKEENTDNNSLLENEDEEKIKEKENSIKQKTKIDRKIKNSDKLCGKKRKHVDVEEKEKEKKSETNKVIEDENELIFNKMKYINLEKTITNKEDERQNDEIRRHITEKNILKELVKKEGFLKIFNYLTIMPLDRKNPLEKEIDDILMSLGLLRTTLILFQIKFEIAEKDNNNNSIKKINNNAINTNNETHVIKPNRNKNKNRILNSSSEKDEDYDVKIVADGVDDEVRSIKITQNRYHFNLRHNKSQDLKINLEKKKNNSSPKSKSVIKDSPKEEYELGVHLQKDKEGKIYKYTKHHYRANKGNDIYVYYCADTKCKSKGCYYVKTMKFENIRNHEIEHGEHCYIKNKDRLDKFTPIIEEFKKRQCHEAQIFKRDDGSQLVKWYD